MNKEKFIEWFLNEPDYRFLNDPVIKFSEIDVIKINFTQCAARIDFQFWGHDPSTINENSALIKIPYRNKPKSCSEDSFPKQIGLFKWCETFGWKTDQLFEALSPVYERETNKLDIVLFDWSDNSIPKDVLDTALNSFDKWSLGAALTENKESSIDILKSLTPSLTTFFQECIYEFQRD